MSFVEEENLPAESEIIDVEQELNKDQYRGYSGDFFMCVKEMLGWQKKVKKDVFYDVVAWCEMLYG